MPPLSNLAGPVQHFKDVVLEAWRDKVSVDLCGRKGFRGGPLLDVHGSLQLLTSSHVRERDKALLRSIMCGMVFFLDGFEARLFHVGFVLDWVTGVSSSGAGFFLISLLPAGIIGVGVMLIRFARLVIFSVVGFFLLFLGLSSLFRELSYRVSFLLCSPLVLSILVLIL